MLGGFRVLSSELLPKQGRPPVDGENREPHQCTLLYDPMMTALRGSVLDGKFPPFTAGYPANMWGR